MDSLKNRLGKDYIKKQDNLEDYFKSLAEELFKFYVIQKGDIQYWLTDIEFYLYHDQRRDIITYPRNCKAGEWFFHPSGVDIAFESHVKKKGKKATLTQDAFFGGILIRGIKRIVPKGEDILFDGPMLSCDELFDRFDAFGEVKNFPKLVRVAKDLPYDKPLAEKRYNLKKDAEEKVSSILSNNYTPLEDERLKDELIQAYRHYWDKEYRYTRYSKKRS